MAQDPTELKGKGPKIRKDLLASLRSSGQAAAVAPEVPQADPTSPPVTAVEPASAEDSTALSPSAQVPEPATPPAQPERVQEVDSEKVRAELAEIVQLGARDSIFFSRHFFPKTFRQEPAPFHPAIWDILDDPVARYINIQAFRGSAKTSLLRTYICKRIAYGLSRTIVYIGSSEDKAKTSLEWVKNQVTNNRVFAQTFGLSKKKSHWQQVDVRITHGPMQFDLAIQVFGINGSIRGTNIDDWRPDLIVLDDVIGDGNSSTPEQRDKITSLILGAVKESLAPRSETPDAKLVIINTPQDYEDLSQVTLKDPQFRSERFGCWTRETENLPTEYQESAWPARWTSEELRAEKTAAIARNKYSEFAREMECKLVTLETSAFRAEWIQYFGHGEEEPEPPRNEMWVEYVIDPVPPPSELQISKGLVGKDYEAHTVVGRLRGKYYVLETVYNRGHDPGWTGATFFELCNRWAPRKVLVESVAYQRTLTWLLKEAMKKTGKYVAIEPFDDKRKKYFKITQGLHGPLSNRAVYFRKSQTALISQVIHYPGKNPDGSHDDLLETAALGITSLAKGHVGDIPVDHYMHMEADVPALEWRGAP